MQISDLRFKEISDQLDDFRKRIGRQMPYYYFLWHDTDALVKYLCPDNEATRRVIKEDIENFRQTAAASAEEMHVWAKMEEKRMDAELGVQFVIERF